MVCSMSRKGNCWDNAPTESFFNSYKNERVHGTHYETRADTITDAFDYIEPFYNRRRRHSTLGYASPQQFLNDWIRRQHEQKLAA
jgi:putative transposase